MKSIIERCPLFRVQNYIKMIPCKDSWFPFQLLPSFIPGSDSSLCFPADALLSPPWPRPPATRAGAVLATELRCWLIFWMWCRVLLLAEWPDVPSMMARSSSLSNCRDIINQYACLLLKSREFPPSRGLIYPHVKTLYLPSVHASSCSTKTTY